MRNLNIQKVKTSDLDINNINLVDSFLESNVGALFYSSTKHLNYLSNIIKNASFYYIIVKDNNNEIKAVASYATMLGKYGMVFNSLPFFGSNGSVVSSESDAFNLALEELLAESEKSDVSTIVENPLSHSLIMKNYDYVIERNFHLKDLRAIGTEEELMKSYHYKTRNTVRKSLKNNFEIVNDLSYLPFLIETHTQNMIAVGGKSKPSQVFDSMLNNFRENIDLWVCLYEGKPISGLLNIRYKDTIEYYTPVIMREYRSLQPLSFLINESMKVAIKDDFSWWNWGGSWLSQTDLVRFKNRWGSDTGIYRCYTKVKNKKILDQKPDSLLEEYPFFFTVPFDKLRCNL